jgi:hypothetical protein
VLGLNLEEWLASITGILFLLLCLAPYPSFEGWSFLVYVCLERVTRCYEATAWPGELGLNDWVVRVEPYRCYVINPKELAGFKVRMKVCISVGFPKYIELHT